MEFPNTVRVNGKELDPLAKLTTLPPLLGLTIEDLRRVEREIQGKYDLGEINSGFINVDETHYPISIFETFIWHGRTTHSRPRAEFPVFEEVHAVKGSGLLGWPKALEATNGAGIKRRYPIVVREDRDLDSHRFWGGESITFAEHQYVNALILNALIKRHSLPQSTYFPLRVIGFEQLPVMENEEMKICHLEDYCDQGFSFSKDHVKVPTLDQAQKFAQLHYVGDTLDFRVLTGSMKDDGGHRYYAPGALSKLGNTEEKRQRVVDFTRKVASLTKIVHEHGGSFAAYTSNRPLTSLSANNVSLQGNVCDLDTLEFSAVGDIKRLQAMDYEFALRTCIGFAEMLDIISLNDSLTPGAYKIERFGTLYATLGLGTDSKKAFSEIYHKPNLPNWIED
ncbi:hypothetical protein J4416_03410 [Candidatus Pacearchaeota archaeon]|nr:hypothetical protein [Candidatus Pacearchaeota archaeon]